MPKYYGFKVSGYFLLFTSKCVVECMHVHASGGDLAAEGIRLIARTNALARDGENYRSALVGADVWFDII